MASGLDPSPLHAASCAKTQEGRNIGVARAFNKGGFEPHSGIRCQSRTQKSVDHGQSLSGALPCKWAL